MKSHNNYHQILEVSESATRDEIKAAYKKLALQYHPDKLVAESPDQQSEVNERFRRIHEAYEELIQASGGKNSCEVPQLTMNSLEIDYFCSQFPALTYNQIDHLAEMVDDNYRYIIRARSEFEDNKSSKDEYIKKMIFLPYELNALEHLTEAEVLEKLNNAKERYANVKNMCNDFAFLWQAKKTGCGDIYLFGTMHVMSPAFYRFQDAINALIEKSDVVITEIIERVYPEVGDSTIDMSRFKVIDSYIANRAHSLGKTLFALENDQLREIVYKYSMVDRPDSNDTLKRGYQFLEALATLDRADSQRIIQEALLSLGECEKGQLRSDRNMLWMDVILQPSQIEKKRCFIGAGAVHMRGVNGIPNLLHHEGYTLTPLMKVLPMTSKEMLRQSLFSQRTIFDKLTHTVDQETSQIKDSSPAFCAILPFLYNGA